MMHQKTKRQVKKMTTTTNRTKHKILCLVPQLGFDPTECAVPWHILTTHREFNNTNNTTQAAASSAASSSFPGFQVVFAAPDKTKPAAADPIMLDGVGLYLLKWSMRANDEALACYSALQASKALEPPNLIDYNDALQQVKEGGEYVGLLLPGGHCPDMRPYLESETARKIIAAFAERSSNNGNNTIAAVCHGVVAAARAGILKNKKVTTLNAWQEGLAHNLTRLWMGSYYKTYEGRTCESEVTAACKEFVKGPVLSGMSRDSAEKPTGFVVRDGNLITARWPGDCFAFAFEFGRTLMQAINNSSQAKPQE